MGLFAPARMAARVSGWDRQDAGVVARETASGALVAGTVGAWRYLVSVADAGGLPDVDSRLEEPP